LPKIFDFIHINKPFQNYKKTFAKKFL
jgi:hypothetical protein